MVYSICELAGVMQMITLVLEFPASELLRIFVKVEFL
jgi:hypothetical protein